MKKFRLSDSGARGWFIGDFPEAIIRTKDFECCWQPNKAGTKDRPHYHKIVTEVQLVTRGKIVINGEEFGPGDIYVSEPGESYYAEYLEDTEVVALKFPSIPDDKHYIPETLLPFDNVDNIFLFEAESHDLSTEQSTKLFIEKIYKQCSDSNKPIVIFIPGYPLEPNITQINLINQLADSVTNSILLVTGALGNWHDKIDTKLNFKISNHRYFEFESNTIWKKQWKQLPKLNAKKTKKFLFASTKDYPTRRFLLANIINNDFLAQGYVGYSCEVITNYMDELGDKNDVVNSYAATIDHHFPLPKLDDGLYWADMPEEARTDSYLNIVTDTFYHLNKNVFFLSEKIFNAMAYGQMFLYIGPAGTLDYLKNQGYQTFGDFIDESYDNIQDPYQRLVAANKSLLSFLSKSIEEIEEIYKECLPRLLYNQQKFLDYDYKSLILNDLYNNANK